MTELKEGQEYQVMEEFAHPFKLQVYYKDMQYKVAVMNTQTNEVAEEFIPATYEPRFGVDVDDMQTVLDKAEEICKWFENKNNVEGD